MVPPQGAEHLRCLDGVDGAAAAEAHDDVRGRHPKLVGDPEEILAGRVGPGALGLLHHLHAGGCQGVFHPADQPVVAWKVVVHQGGAARQLGGDSANLAQNARAEDVPVSLEFADQLSCSLRV